VTVTADVVGLSVASYQWLKDDEALSTAQYPACNGLSTNELTISSFTHDYEGKYQCAVSFSGSEVVKSSHIELALGMLVPSASSSSLERGGDCDMWQNFLIQVKISTLRKCMFTDRYLACYLASWHMCEVIVVFTCMCM
jgi:hypothetical protein